MSPDEERSWSVVAVDGDPAIGMPWWDYTMQALFILTGSVSIVRRCWHSAARAAMSHSYARRWPICPS